MWSFLRKMWIFDNGDETFNVFHNLFSLAYNLAKEVKIALVYIAGYVTKNDHVDRTKYYVEKSYAVDVFVVKIR